jgi:hypothetical protein
MLKLLRRSRLVPILLLLAMPGVGGALVQAGHPCAEKAPWTAGSPAAGGHQHHGSDAGSAGDPVPPGHPCECVGACQSPGVNAGPAAVPTVVAVAIGLDSSAAPVHRASAPRPRAERLLPPAHAPPLS